jgi:hypothetical protein
MNLILSENSARFFFIVPLVAPLDQYRLEVSTILGAIQTSATGEGAKNLEPAVKLLERLGKAFSKAKVLSIEY